MTECLSYRSNINEDVDKIERDKDADNMKIRERKNKNGNDDTLCLPMNEKRYRGYGFKEDLSPWVKFKLPIVGEIRMNPIVSITAIALIWGFVIWCAIQRQDVPFEHWKNWIVHKLTWLYIGSNDVWAIFVIVLYFSKYANIKLGKPEIKLSEAVEEYYKHYLPQDIQKESIRRRNEKFLYIFIISSLISFGIYSVRNKKR